MDIPKHRSDLFFWEPEEQKAWTTIPDLAKKLGHDAVVDFNGFFEVESVDTGVVIQFKFEPKISNRSGLGYIFYSGSELMKDWILFIYNKQDKS